MKSLLQGRFDVTNATLDMSRVESLFQGFPIERYFWRIRVEAFDYKKIIAIVAGGYFLRGKT